MEAREHKDNFTSRVSKGLRPSVIVTAVVGILCVIVITATYAWMQDDYGLTSGSRAGRLMRSLNSQQKLLDFSVSEDARLLPGTTIRVTDRNRVLPHHSIGDFLYRITYTVQDESGLLAEEINLSPESIKEYGLVNYGDLREGNTITKVYFGRHDRNEPIVLGPLFLTCGTDMDQSTSQNIMISAELMICQNDSAAFCDIFEIAEDKLDVFAHLIEVVGDDDEMEIME